MGILTKGLSLKCHTGYEKVERLSESKLTISYVHLSKPRLPVANYSLHHVRGSIGSLINCVHLFSKKTSTDIVTLIMHVGSDCVLIKLSINSTFTSFTVSTRRCAKSIQQKSSTTLSKRHSCLYASHEHGLFYVYKP